MKELVEHINGLKVAVGELDNKNNDIRIAVMALVNLLQDKGIITSEEYTHALKNKKQ